MGSIENYYRILDVSYDATFNEIKEAYRKKVKELHPDKEKGDTEEFKKVKEAYENLKSVEESKRNRKKQEGPANRNPCITIVNIQRKSRKQVTILPVMMNAAVILIGVLVNTYIKGKR